MPKGKGNKPLLDQSVKDQATLKRWYLSSIDELAQEGGVGVVSIEGMSWSEIDFLRDLPIAEAKVANFVTAPEQSGLISNAI